MRSIKFSVQIFLLLILTSCKKDFLDVPNKSVILRQAYVKDLITTNDYLNGIYIELSLNIYHCYSGIYAEVIADNIKPVVGGPALNIQYTWSQTADNEKFAKISPQGQNANGLWLAGYRIIRDCNFVIESADRYGTKDEPLAKQIKAEAYGIRAFVHHLLVCAFAQPYLFSPTASHPGVPYVTTSDWREPITRQSVAEVYSKIEADLNTAIKLSPDESLNRIKMNKKAVKAILARVLLFKGDYLGSKIASKDVSDECPITTISSGYPDKIFHEANFTSEVLFQLPPAGSGSGYNTFFPGGVFRSLKQFYATHDIGNILVESPTDVRIKWVSNEGGEFSITKFPRAVTGSVPNGDADYFIPIVRTSEMYLTAAECFAHLNNEDSARYFLNAIRKRADTTATDIMPAGNDLLEMIYRERRKELSFEGIRMFDILRCGLPVQRIDATDPSAKNLPFPSNKAIAPIPLSDVQISGLRQNTDY